MEGNPVGALTSALEDISLPRSGVKFNRDDTFYRALRRRVDGYFDRTGKSRRDCIRMYVKTAIILGWVSASYLLLVFGMGGIWAAIPLAISLGLSMAAVGFNIQHDGGHHAYSDRPWINKITAMTLDLLGGSSYIWARKHNSIHHSFSNITGEDDDINLGFLGRLSPHQKHRWFHRFQHFYLWVLYGFLPAKWQILDDFLNVAFGRIGEHRLPRPKGWDLFFFIGGKAFFFSLAIVVPMLLHPWWYVITLYFLVTYVQGVVLSVVFQLAHAVEDAEFPMPQEDTGRMEKSWAEHQVDTTVDFARGNRLLSWYIGGLNFQIEHHLFAQICHIHYPALAPVVESTCREFGIRYNSHRTFRAGVASHFRWLKRMGRQDQTSESTLACSSLPSSRSASPVP